MAKVKEPVTHVVTEQTETNVKEAAAIIVPEKPTLESLKAAAKEASKKSFEIAQNDEADETEKLAAMMASYKATKAVTDFINAEKAEAARAEQEAKINEQKNLFWDAIKAHDENNRIGQARIADPASFTIEESNAANEAFKAAAEKVLVILAGKRPNVVLHVAGNVTGEKLDKATRSTGVGKEIEDLLLSGKTKAEIMALGYARGTTGSVYTQLKKDGKIQ